MKRKFLSIAICLMFCFTSVFILSACGEEKPMVVAKEDAEVAMATAMTTLEETKTIKMTMDMPMNMGGMVVIATENSAYIEMRMSFEDIDSSYDYSMKTWSKLENGAFTTYAIMSETEGATTEKIATKQVLLENLDVLDSEAAESLEGIDFDNFVEATELNGELSVVFSEESSDGNVTLTAKIVNNKLVSITSKQGMVSVTMYIHYGDFSAEIPLVPEEDWVITSKIEVPNLKTEFVVGEELSLEGLKLKLFEDKTSSEFVEINLTNDMISSIVSGFDTSEAKSDGVMTISYYGLTIDVDYTVIQNFNQQETSTLLTQVAQSMQGYVEITGTSTVSGEVSQNVVTKDVEYSYYDENNKSWLLKDSEDNKWYEYYMSYDENTKTHTYTKTEVEVTNNDLRTTMFSQLFERLSMLTFVGAVNDGDKIVVEYQIVGQTTVNVKIIIEDGLMTSMIMSTPNTAGGDPIILQTETFVCNQTETITIPDLPDVEWVLE